MNMQPIFIELPSEPMQEIYRTVQQVAESDLSFFIVGETEVGKEGVAQYVHNNLRCRISCQGPVIANVIP